MKMNISGSEINRFDQKEYLVSTIDLKATVSIQFAEGYEEYIDITTTFQSAIYLCNANHLPNPLHPVLTVNLVNTIPINEQIFHQLVCRVIKNERIEDVKIADTYKKYSYEAVGKDMYSPFSLSTIRHIFIFKLIKD